MTKHFKQKFSNAAQNPLGARLRLYPRDPDSSAVIRLRICSVDQQPTSSEAGGFMSSLKKSDRNIKVLQTGCTFESPQGGYTIYAAFTPN